jgi:hypothetical protein
MSCRRVLSIGAAVLVALAAYPLVRAWLFERHQSRAFTALSIGVSREAVLQLAGQPTYTTDGSRWVEPEHPRSQSELIQGCVEEFWYYHGVSLFPSKWSYCFSDGGNLVHKYHWVSW